MQQHALNPTLKRLLSLCRLDRRWLRGDGVWLIDDDGRHFLDGYAQYGAVVLGHNAPCVTAAVHAALETGEPAMVQPYRAPHAEALANALAEASGLARCVFTNSGAETVEAAIKLVRAKTGRLHIVSAEGSFHGKTMGALGATGQREYSDGFGPPPPGFLRVPFGDAGALEALFAEKGASIAALLLEPIQGERGVHAPPEDYLARARELCTRHGIALILDEIQTGLGRLGSLFACQRAGVTPDALLLAKGLGGGLFPLGACLTTAALWDERFALRHSSTFANNNIACRVGLAVLEALRGGVVDAVEEKAAVLRAGLERLAARYPRAIAAVRSHGLLAAIQLRPVGPETSFFLSYLHHQQLYAYVAAATIAENASVLLLPTLGDANVLRIAPPLTITREQLDTLLDGVESVMALLDQRATDAILRAIGATEQRVTAVREPPIVLPPPPRAATESGGFAFLVHYTRREDVVTTDPVLHRLTSDELDHYCSFIARVPAGVTVEVSQVRSATGATTRGWIISLGLLPEEMMRRGRRHMIGEIGRAVDLAAALGARVVGLGGFTAPLSNRGESVIGRGPAVTTGNCLTAGMAIAAVRAVAARRQHPLGDADVAVVGARGSVGSLCAQLLAAAQPRSLVLVGNPASGTAHLEALRQRLPCDRVRVSTDLRALEGCEVVVAATGAARPVLDQAPLRSGTLICDVARPPDASPALRARRDLTVIDGGLVRLPHPVRLGAGNLQGLPDGIQLACLSETMLLALSGETRDRGIGDDVPVEQVHEVMALAAQHGFALAEPDLDELDAVAQARVLP
jgi:acetylornithine/succinyldiaminopimelate/putrescine aminotransferase/predicted amino acid dehydrogenase